MFVRRPLGVVVHCFEISANNKAVMSAEALRRTFPDRTIIIPLDAIQNPDFLKQLTSALKQLDYENVAALMTQTRKAGSSVVEERDTTAPCLVTEMIMGILSAYGYATNIWSIQKRVRDDVSWLNSKIPWRRLPLWTSIKISIQLYLVNRDEVSDGTVEYKNFLLYFVRGVADLSFRKELSSESLFIINCKLARRAAKLGSGTFDSIQGSVSGTVKGLRNTLQRTWETIQHQNRMSIDAFIPRPSVISDTALGLHSSRPHLERMRDRALETVHSATAPNLPTVRRLLTGQIFSRKSLVSLSSKDIYALADFEEWVRKGLPTMLESCLLETGETVITTCRALGELLKAYNETADRIYKQNSELLSIKFLTIMELWCAVDRIVTRNHPLLMEYSPEIPQEFLVSLLLPKGDDMHRVHAAEKYIESRHQGTTTGHSAFLGNISPASFAVRFYDSSETLPALKAKIELDANKLRENKRVEWEEKCRLLNCYRAQEEQLEHRHCQYDKSDAEQKPDRVLGSASCVKCYLKSDMTRLKIRVHEWPLPTNEVSSKAVLFEIACPRDIAAWRDATWLILQDLGKKISAGRRIPTHRNSFFFDIQDYAPLQPSMFSLGNTGRRRVTLASYSKPFSMTHYSTCKFPVALEAVYLNNGCSFRYADGGERFWLNERFGIPTLHAQCATALPEGPFKESGLQNAVRSTNHSSNQVIAEQHDCPTNLSIDDFISFGHLRSGERLQWINILRELVSGFCIASSSVKVLFCQAAWQAGDPLPHSYLRVSHEIFNDYDFCLRLLEALRDRYQKIEANWSEINAMTVIVRLLLRLLALCPHRTITSVTMSLLRLIKRTAYTWVQKLLELHTDPESLVTRQTVIEGILVCQSTQDVDDSFRSAVFENQEDVSIYVACSMILNELQPEFYCQELADGSVGLIRHAKLCRDLQLVLHRVVVTKSREISAGIRWKNAQSIEKWEYVSKKKDCSWIVGKCTDRPGIRQQVAHFNLLTGSFLIDGKPLDKLPSDYTSHPLYEKLFGSRPLKICVSDIPTLSYMTVEEIFGNIVYFRKYEGQLIVRVYHGQEFLEAIPPSNFFCDLPFRFLSDYIPWFNSSTHEIEFRPLKALWNSSPGNWWLTFSEASSNLSCGPRYLIEKCSEKVKGIVSIFEAIESFRHIEVILTECGQLNVALPRHGLNFFLNSGGQLECSELRAVVDSDQDIGTLYGLKTKLVLREVSGARRKVLIPYGDLKVSRLRGHVLVTVETEGQARVRYFEYHLDEYLRRLCGSGGLVSELYKIYLHAITSFMLPDPFLGWTGTEEALSGLQQASVHQHAPLQPEECTILELIRQLTPSRHWYPKLRKVQQMAQWNEQLPILSQSDYYLPLVDSLVSYNNQFRALHDDSKPVNLSCRGQPHLLARARERNGYLNRCYLRFPEASSLGDLDYIPRDHNGWERVRDVSSLIKQWPGKFSAPQNLYNYVRSFGSVSGFGTPFELQSYSNALELKIQECWGSLFSLCIASTRDNPFRLTFLFSALIYAKPQLKQDVEILLACAFACNTAEIPALACDSFCLLDGHVLITTSVEFEISLSTMHNFVPASKTYSGMPTSERIRTEKETVLRHVVGQWPRPKLELPSQETVPCVDLNRLRGSLSRNFSSWYNNKLFYEYIMEVQSRLDERQRDMPLRLPLVLECRTFSNWVKLPVSQTRFELPTLEAPLVLTASQVVAEVGPFAKQLDSKVEPTPEADTLRGLVSGLVSHPTQASQIRSEYGDKLASSLEVLLNQGPNADRTKSTQGADNLQALRLRLKSCLKGFFHTICGLLTIDSFEGQLLQDADLWPRVTPRTLLKRLASFADVKTPKEWIKAITSFGVAMSLLQRADRLVVSVLTKDFHKLQQDIGNTGDHAWSCQAHGDWLLMELENNFLIRDRQVRVAEELIAPASGSSSLLQFNMGEGKSSVVIPMVAMSLSNGNKMARVVVLKPLLKQMEQVLARRVGGMVNRRLYYLPLARQTKLTVDIIDRVRQLYEECLRTGGILLCQPEHLLSFKLIGIDKHGASDHGLGDKIMRTRDWLSENCRDILDESDEILSTSFELVYTTGLQQMFDGQPMRWTLLHNLFDLVSVRAVNLHDENPQSIEISGITPGTFPRIRILDGEVGARLIAHLVEDIANGQLPGISLEHLSETDRGATIKFISDQACGKPLLDHVQSLFMGTNNLVSLTLLRGIIAFRILSFALRHKRWLVNYGLDLSRTLMAVPYRAKGVPSHSAEFSHPDVAIILTCLSYYYTGLTDDQLMNCFQLLEGENDPDLEYERWQWHMDPEDKLRSLRNVNLRDKDLCRQRLFPKLRFNKAVIDFHLAQVVFPKGAKEFPFKLSSSAWDIPVDTRAVTTGFSGTNDNSVLLPLSITQNDLPELQHTNALVLQKLLRPENSTCLIAATDNGQPLEVNGLLELIATQKPEIRVLIDVGAQVLELTNDQVAKTWLRLSPTAKAAVFFNENDELVVIDRAGNEELLLASAFGGRLGECCIYLDEAHTRGTDLQLPGDYRGAVTLGPQLTKDRFVQGKSFPEKCGSNVYIP